MVTTGEVKTHINEPKFCVKLSSAGTANRLYTYVNLLSVVEQQPGFPPSLYSLNAAVAETTANAKSTVANNARWRYLTEIKHREVFYLA